jgi:uncharacterized protein
VHLLPYIHASTFCVKIIIPGGTGQVGTVLARAFDADGHDVVVLSRNPHKTPWRVVQWNARDIGPWTDELEDADVLINLAGRSVNCRYTEANKKAILSSRVESTRVIGRAIAAARNPPQVWLQASTATIYSHRYDLSNDDITGVIGGSERNVPDTWRFSIDVALAWEAAADETPLPQTRIVKLRSAMVMSPDRGGIFDTLRTLVNRGLGGTAGTGRQYISWIHERDFVNAIYWLIEHDDLSGPINVAAPNPLPNREFMKTLRKACGMAVGLPANKMMLEIGAVFLRTETELVLKSRRVVPKLLTNSGFRFEFLDWREAARHLCHLRN